MRTPAIGGSGLLVFLLAACQAPDKGPSDTSTADSGGGMDTAPDVDTLPSDLNGDIPDSAVPLPSFVARNQHGDARSEADLTGHPTVLWFYPAAGTYGWTVEGCGYRDLQEQFDALGVTIVGAGLDDPSDNLAWAEEERFAFELWTDDDRTLGVTYGALDNSRDSSVARVTMLLDADGELLVSYTDSINVGTHPGLVLEDCERIFGE